MTYDQIFDLRFPASTASVLKKKTTVAVAKIAEYILTAETPATANFENRYRWAMMAIQNAEAVAEQFMWRVVSNADVQSNGEAVADSVITYVVETSVNLFAK